MSNTTAIQVAVYLDSNTLHYIGLYLAHAKTRAAFPFDRSPSASTKAIARDSVTQISDADLKKGLLTGLETVWMIWNRGFSVQYGYVSELELISGRTRGKALLSLAAEGVPERMWSRLTEAEIRDRVDHHAMERTTVAVSTIEALIDESGVAVFDRTSMLSPDLFRIAGSASGLVYLDAIDSMIYAGALLSQCDYLFTSDSYLKDTANKIRDPLTSRYSTVHQQLRQLLSDTLLTDIDDVVLPSAHNITSDGNARPQLPPQVQT